MQTVGLSLGPSVSVVFISAYDPPPSYDEIMRHESNLPLQNNASHLIIETETRLPNACNEIIEPERHEIK